MASHPDDKWGPTLSVYLANASRTELDEPNDDKANKTSSRSPKAAMEDFLARTYRSVSITALDEVLSLAQKPTNLTVLSNTGVIPACIRVLKNYAQGDRVSQCLPTRLH